MFAPAVDTKSAAAGKTPPPPKTDLKEEDRTNSRAGDQKAQKPSQNNKKMNAGAKLFFVVPAFCLFA